MKYVSPEQATQLSSSSSTGESDAESTPPLRKRVKKEERSGQISSDSSTTESTAVPHASVLSPAVQQELPLPGSTSLISYKVFNKSGAVYNERAIASEIH